MINTLLIIVIPLIPLIIFYFINSFILRNELKKYTNDYRIYFEKEHINKHPFLYIFFTMFMLLYYKYHKDKLDYGFLKYKVDMIDELKKDDYIKNVYFKYHIEGEDEILKKVRSCELKIKLKKIKKMNNNDNG